MFIEGEWVPQEETTINMLEALNNPIVGDVWSCAHLKFLHDLFLATPTESLNQSMLGDHEEWDERQAIYAHHVDT
jgi:hypothetical protein